MVLFSGDRSLKHKFTLNIDEQLVEEIKIQAVREKRTVGEITEQLYREYLDRHVKVKVEWKSKQNGPANGATIDKP